MDAWGQSALTGFRKGVCTWNIICGLGDIPHHVKFEAWFAVGMNSWFVVMSLIHWYIDTESLRMKRPYLNMIGGLALNGFTFYASGMRQPLMPYVGIIGYTAAEYYDILWKTLHEFHQYTCIAGAVLIVLHIVRSLFFKKKAEKTE
eukprot:gnl/TRDRNA2_/TRDRNA2_197498_c0_seq1.p1 gnl/TRDRNA2_/TRDRNA2_197498_c0~~gnl/TRDRNA2_/TRDRNA2_197498_c0_seq1.p1  ORF type:complete len:159 (+),score=24.12 gnl/TRDRNA2_/TRDRNA2_197498_c0_seq1:40-477(+)